MGTPGKSVARRRRGRALLVSSLGIALISSVSFYLGTTGAVATSISPPAGSPTSGSFADITSLSAAVTRTNGGAQLQTGVALAKITMSSAVTSSALVNIAWTNVAQATQVLTNPNSQISIGIYYTIHSGYCNASSKSVDAPLVNLTDTDSAQYCLALDQSATGRFASSTGKLLLTGSQVGGFLMPNLTSSSLAACTTSLVDTGPWCQPSSVTNANQRALWVIASITTPGGIPQGQQGNINTLSFFISVQAA